MILRAAPKIRMLRLIAKLVPNRRLRRQFLRGLGRIRDTAHAVLYVRSGDATYLSR